jgi:hypothetical protein
VSKNTVTKEQIDTILLNAEVNIQTVGEKTTIVHCVLPNGFVIVESSSCVDPSNYDEKLGAEICLKRIENKVWELEGYVLQNSVYLANQIGLEQDVEESYINHEPKEDYGRSFKELFPTFIAGTPIKRKVWRGYWVYKYGKIEIHTKTGEIINFTDTTDILFTVSGILENDWEVATNENCDIPVK